MLGGCWRFRDKSECPPNCLGILGRSVLAVDFDNFAKLLDKGWVKTLWQFCSESDITVED